MTYDFQTIRNRTEQGSLKWLLMNEEKANLPNDIVPLSVADVDMPHPPELIDGLKDYLDEVIFGYSGPTPAYNNAVVGWMKRKHNWDVKEEWLVQSPGVIPAIYNTIELLTGEDDGIIIMPPVYYPFELTIQNSNRKVVRNNLHLENNAYTIDFSDLEEKAKDPANKLLIFCNPHNPVGRVWTKEELAKIGQICDENDVFILSDEIHFDIIMPGHKHTVFATISDEIRENMIVATAPSKTFNLAGLQASNIIIPNDEVRERYIQQLARKGVGGLNVLGYKACEIAYTKLDDYLEEFLELIVHNHKTMKDYLNKELPELVVFDLEGTYLQWVDMRALGMDKDQLERFIIDECALFLDEGYIFGEVGEGFERFNIACPTEVLKKGLERLVKAVKAR